MLDMAKKTSDKIGRKAKRTTLPVPTEWHSVLAQMAARRQQPKLWVLIGMLMERAEKEGLPHPKPPWEQEADGTEA
jgi:hypothetical protein